MANQEFTRHRLSSLCGDMDAESFNALVQDIRDQGQRAAVVMLAADWMPPHRPAAKEKGDTVSPLSNDAAAARAGLRDGTRFVAKRERGLR